MFRTLSTALLCWLFLLARSHAQDVFVPRELKAIAVTHPEKEHPPKTQKAPRVEEPVLAKQSATTPLAKTAPVKNPAANTHGEKVQTSKAEPVKVPVAKEAPPKPHPEKVESVKTDPVKVPAVKEAPPDPRREKVQTVKTEPVKVPAVKEASPDSRPEKVQSVKIEPLKVPKLEKPPANPLPEKLQSVKTESVTVPPLKEPPANPRPDKVQSVNAEPIKTRAKEPPTSSHPEVKSVKAEVKAPAAKTEPVNAPTVKGPVVNLRSEKGRTAKTEPVKASPVKEPTAKVEPVKAAGAKEPASNPRPEKLQSVTAESAKTPAMKETSASLPPDKVQSVKVEPGKTPPEQDPTVNVQLLNRRMETGSTRLADGFDFPVGKPDAEGYYKARGFRSGGHMGEDWDGVRGGDTDFNDPIYCIGDGIVVFARDVHLGWGNVVIVRHAYRESGTVKHIDSLYGHLNSILVSRGQRVARGQRVGTMGTAHGQYDAHLHLEIRKNLEIGMSRSKFQKNLSNYYDPSQFIASHRHLSGGGANFRVAMNTFTHDSAFHFDDSPNFSARKRSTAQSAAALKRAISSTTP